MLSLLALDTTNTRMIFFLSRFALRLAISYTWLFTFKLTKIDKILNR